MIHFVTSSPGDTWVPEVSKYLGPPREKKNLWYLGNLKQCRLNIASRLYNPFRDFQDKKKKKRGRLKQNWRRSVHQKLKAMGKDWHTMTARTEESGVSTLSIIPSDFILSLISFYWTQVFFFNNYFRSYYSQSHILGLEINERYLWQLNLYCWPW